MKTSIPSPHYKSIPFLDKSLASQDSVQAHRSMIPRFSSGEPATGRIEDPRPIATFDSFDDWMAGWGTASTGSPYRSYEGRAMGIKKKTRTGYHWWTNENDRPSRASEYTWSVGFPTQHQAMESLFEYLHNGAVVSCMTTCSIAGQQVTEAEYRRR
jgi:hypothetical protein